MNSDGTINFNKLETDLNTAVEQDTRYQRENDAKFRAVEQKVGSYEEFKDIVAACHLRPLDKKDREGLHNRKQPWNPYADKKGKKALTTAGSQAAGVVKVPKNSHEFLQHWKQCGSDKSQKYCYLIKTGSTKLCEMFKAEISMGLLGDIIDVLCENWNAVDSSCIYEILCGLSTVKRFSLSLQFLSKNETEMLRKLFNKLEDTLGGIKDDVDKKSLIELKKVYGIMVES